MNKSLKDRFDAFMTSLPHVELIDDINIDPPISGLPPKRADYFWFERQIIVELKNLEEDTAYKVHKEMDKHRDREDYPIFYGEAPLHHVLSHLPDGDAIHRKIHRAITRQIEDYFRSANKQIRDAKSQYNLPSSIGLLTILNENIGIMTPSTVQYKVSELLISIHPDGSPRFPHIDYVWILFESHQAPVRNSVMGLPSVLIAKSVTPDSDRFNALFEEIESGWAQHNGMLFIPMKAEKVSSINFQETYSKRDQNEQGITRQEFWIKMYQEAPYMRSLSDEAVLEYGARTIETLKPYFLKGGPRVPMEGLEKMMIPFSDFLEEAQYRGLDLKDLLINRQV